MTHHPVWANAVIGVTDARSGEAVKASLVKKDPNLTAEEAITVPRARNTDQPRSWRPNCTDLLTWSSKIRAGNRAMKKN